MTREALCAAAIEAMKKAYAPYSGYKVGAALLTANGNVYTGCNIENASYTPTVCAERTAIFRALVEGEREFSKIAISGGKAGEHVSASFPPCGVCRQVLAEFCSGDFEILLAGDTVKKYTLSELLPASFTKENMD